MTTFYATRAITQLDNAAFQDWITALHNSLVGAGFVQTTDTGQADFSTVTKPGTTNSSAGFRVYRFDDSLQATAPIFIKIEVGTGTSAAYFGWRVSVGNATDGAGGMSGPIQTNSGWVSQPANTFSGINENFACHTEGAGWCGYCRVSTTYGCMLGFAIMRTTDDAGAPSAEGAVVYLAQGGTTDAKTVMLRFASTAAVLYSANSAPCCVPFAMTDSHIGVDVQFFPHWTAAPKVRLNPFAFSWCAGELTHGAAITTDVIDGTSRTYMPAQGRFIGAAGSGLSTGHGTAFVWE